MVWDVLRVVIPVIAIGFGVVTQPPLRMFIGTVLGALGIVALLVAAAVHSAEAIPVLLAGLASTVAGVALVWWGYDHSSVPAARGDTTHPV